jgi:hypothetical protein
MGVFIAKAAAHYKKVQVFDSMYECRLILLFRPLR